MLIHSPEITQQDGEIRVSSRIEYARKSYQLPNELWFSFPEKQFGFISNRSDGFLVSLLLLAMNLREDLEVRGVVSPKLAYNLEQFQWICQSFFPRLFQPVELTFERLDYPQEDPRAVVTSFSGGTDSLFTIWSQRNQSQPLPPTDELTHGLFIHGFDFQRFETDLYFKLAKRYTSVLSNLGMDLLLARSNFRTFYSLRIDWLLANFAPLVGTVLVLGKGIRRYIKPTDAEALHGNIRRPSYAIHLLSTEETEIVLHAPHIHRYQRIQFIANWEPAQNHLRVCTNIHKDPDGKACYRCTKCIAVGLYLEMLSIRPSFTNFPRPVNTLDFAHFILKLDELDIYTSSWWLKALVRMQRYDFVALYVLLFFPLLFKHAGLWVFTILVPPNLRLWIKHRVIKTDWLT